MINYAELERIYRLEKNSPGLQPIHEGFFQDALKLAGSPEALEHGEHMQELINEIYDRRLSKLVLHAARTYENPSNPDNTNRREADLYYKLISLLTSNRKEQLLSKPIVDKPDDSSTVSMKKIRLLQGIPVIMGVDENEYGPFISDDVVELPLENASILIEKGIAEDI